MPVLRLLRVLNPEKRLHHESPEQASELASVLLPGKLIPEDVKVEFILLQGEDIDNDICKLSTEAFWRNVFPRLTPTFLIG